MFNLRFPTWRELLGLFVAPTHVATITAGIDRNVAALKGVVEHQLDLADQHDTDRDLLQIQVRKAESARIAAVAHAARAGRIADKLQALVA